MADVGAVQGKVADLVGRLLTKMKIDDISDNYAAVLSSNINRFYSMSNMKAIDCLKKAKRLARSSDAFNKAYKPLKFGKSPILNDFVCLLVEISKDSALKAVFTKPEVKKAIPPTGMISESPLVSTTTSKTAGKNWTPSSLNYSLNLNSKKPLFGLRTPNAPSRVAGQFADVLSPTSAKQLANIKLPKLSTTVKRPPEDDALVDLGYGTKVVLRSQDSKFLKSDGKRLSTSIFGMESFLISHVHQLNDIGTVRFQDTVCLCCSQGKYVTADENGTIGLSRKSIDAKAKWTIVPAHLTHDRQRGGKLNLLNQTDAIGDVKIFDQVALKSCYGTYLTARPDGTVGATKGNVGSGLVWQVSKTELPFVPNWTRKRLYLLWNPESILNLVGERSDMKTQKMLSLPSTAQEQLILNDILYAMMGVEGKFTKLEKTGSLSKGSEGSTGDWTFHLGIDIKDMSMKYIIERILPLGGYYYNINEFVQLHSRYEFGLVNHALAACIRAMLKNYLILIAQLEHQFNKGQLTLQRLWYSLQPSLHSLKKLHGAVKQVQGFTGGAVLNALFKAMNREGDAATQAIYHHLLEKTSVPYLSMLELWIYEGIIQDPYDEFQVLSNDDLSKENLNKDFNDTYWEMRYTIRTDRIPAFLGQKSLVKKILVTGKYLNVIRECGLPVENKDKQPIRYSNDVEVYRKVVNDAYVRASKQVLDLLLKKQKLVERLRSIKRYFLLDQGDFFVHFMDIAKVELRKSVNEIVRRKLESLLELAVRTSAAKHDPYKDDLSCFLQRYTLMQKLDAIHSTSETNPSKWRPDPRTAENPPPAPAVALKGLDAFTLKYKVRWPLSLIISMKSLTKYQLIFRHLFYCKHVEAQLCQAWLNQQSMKELNVKSAFHRAYILRQRMLHFLQNLVYYMMVEVLEPNWHTMVSKLKEAKSVDEVLHVHDSFLDNCLTQCLLNNQQLFKILTKLMTTCLLFAEQTKRSAASIQANLNKYSESKRHRSRLTKIETESRHARLMIAEGKYNEMISSFDAKFSSNVGQFIKILRSKSNMHYEHHLANLSTRLDYNGFYTQCFPEVLDDAYAAIPAEKRKDLIR